MFAATPKEWLHFILTALVTRGAVVFPLCRAGAAKSNDSVINARNIAVAALVLLTVGAYSNSFSGAFVFDDLPAIRDNPTIRTLWPLGGALSPPENSGVGGRPLANLSFALNYAFGGAGVVGYHGGNLLLHGVSALLLFGIVRRTLRLVGEGDERKAVGMALAVATCWSVHPITTASVSYVSQRTEVLMGACYLLTLYAFIRGAAAGSRKWFGAAVIACALGMMAKEVMVTAPVVVLLYDRAFLSGSWREAWRRHGRCYVGLAASWLVLGWVLTSGLAQRSVGYGLGVAATDYALMEARAIVHYLRLAFVPGPLIFDYGPVYAPNMGAVFVVALLVSTTVWAVVRGSRRGFLAAGFFVLLAPTSSVVPVAEQPIAENRMYLPLAVLIVLVAVALRATLRGRAAVAGWCLIVPALVGLTLLRNADYRTELSVWTDTVAKRPESWRAHFNLGVALLDLGRAAEAERSFERVIQLKPNEAKAHNSLGNALLTLGRVPEASARFKEAVRLQPQSARAWYNLGTALSRQGDTTGAVEAFERAIRIEPGMADGHSALGNVFFQMDQPAQALERYVTALRIDPSLADAHYNSGNANLELGRVDEAIRHFRAAVKLKPDDAEIRNHLGAALVKAGRLAESLAEFEHALRLKPDYADARDNRDLVRRELERAK